MSALEQAIAELRRRCAEAAREAELIVRSGGTAWFWYRQPAVDEIVGSIHVSERFMPPRGKSWRQFAIGGVPAEVPFDRYSDWMIGQIEQRPMIRSAQAA